MIIYRDYTKKFLISNFQAMIQPFNFSIENYNIENCLKIDNWKLKIILNSHDLLFLFIFNLF